MQTGFVEVQRHSHGGHIGMLITTLRSNSRGSDNLFGFFRHLHSTHPQHTSTHMDTDVDTDLHTLLGIKFPVAGFLHRQYNKPNQMELINPDLMNRAVQSKAKHSCDSQEGRRQNRRAYMADLRAKS